MGSQVSFASDVYENIDLDETEQNMKEVDALTDHIKYYNQKIETSEKNLVKRR